MLILRENIFSYFPPVSIVHRLMWRTYPVYSVLKLVVWAYFYKEQLIISICCHYFSLLILVFMLFLLFLLILIISAFHEGRQKNPPPWIAVVNKYPQIQMGIERVADQPIRWSWQMYLEMKLWDLPDEWLCIHLKAHQSQALRPHS